MECPFYSWLYHYLLLSLLPSLGYWLQRRRQRDGGKLAHYTPRCCCCWTHPGVVDVTSFGSLFSVRSPCENVEKYIFKKKKKDRRKLVSLKWNVRRDRNAAPASVIGDADVGPDRWPRGQLFSGGMGWNGCYCLMPLVPSNRMMMDRWMGTQVSDVIVSV